MARIDYKSYVNTVIKSEKYGEVKILDYEKDGRDHLFEIEFIDTGNVAWTKWINIKNKKIIDYALKKKIAQRKKRAAIIKRNRIMKHHETKFSKENNSGKVLSLDFATKKVGFSYWENNKHIKSSSFEATEDDCFRNRTNEIVDYLLNIIDKLKVDTVLLEGIYLGYSVDILAMLAEARGFLIRELLNRNIRLEIIPANTVRSALGAPKHREEIKEFAIIVFVTETNIYTNDDDMADAYCQAKYFCGNY